MARQHHRGRQAAVVAGIVPALALPVGSVPAAAQGTAATACDAPSAPITLDYWSWGAGYADAAALWNEQNPMVQVQYSDIPVGNAGGYQKMRTAAEAGQAPDVMFLEFDTVPSFLGSGAIIDIGAYAAPDQLADFVAPILSQVALGGDGTMYAAPIGSGPMGLIYRKDLLDQHGIAVPTTWEEFATAAAKVREVDPNAYLVNWDGSGNANWFAGLASQDGAQWFNYDAGTGAWGVTVNGDESKAVAAYWQQLLSTDAASDLATFSPEWSAALANGTLWSWPTAVWGVGVIKSAAPDTGGGWAVAPLPSWGTDKPGSGSWGGGGLAVSKDSENPCWASQFALWMATDPGAMKIVNAAIGIYPTTNTLLADPMFAEPDPFFGGQPVFEVFKDASANLAPFVWGPDMSDTYQAVMDGFSGSFTSGFATTLDQSLDAAQAGTVAAMTRQGYTVAQ